MSAFSTSFIDGFNVTPDPLQSDHCAEKLRALGEPLRIKIIDALRACPLNVGELADRLESEVVTISHHLGVLCDSIHGAGSSPATQQVSGCANKIRIAE